MKKYFLLGLIFPLFLQAYAQENLPTLNLKNNKGKLVNVSEIPTNNVTVFSFWATWCIPCINELDAINEEYTNWQDETNVKLIAVSIDNSRTVSRVKTMANGKEWDFEILFDTNQEFKRAVNVTSIPYVILVKNSKIVYSRVGYTPGSEYELYEKIKEFSK